MTDSQGFEWFIAFYEDGRPTSGYRYHAHGSGSVDFEKGKGDFNRHNGKTFRDFPEGIPKFPDSPMASKVTYDVELLDPAKMKYVATNPRFFDMNGAELGQDGKATKPTPDSVMVTDGRERFWRDGNSIYRPDGTKAYELEYSKKKLTRLDVFDEMGNLVLSQALGATPSLAVVDGKKKTVLTSPEPQKFKDPKAFVKQFNKTYAKYIDAMPLGPAPPNGRSACATRRIQSFTVTPPLTVSRSTLSMRRWFPYLSTPPSRGRSCARSSLA